MSFDYASVRDGDVAEVLAEFGVAADLIQWTKGAYDPAARSHGTGSTVNESVTVVVVSYNEREIDGALIQRRDKRIIMGGAEVAPRMNDKITVGGTTYEIIDVDPISPDDTVVLAYFIQARK